MPVHHVSINVSDINEAREFYVAALKPLGYKIVMNLGDQVLGFGGLCGPDFWLVSLDAPHADGSEVRHGNGNNFEEQIKTQGKREPTGRVHVAFSASNRQKVREFHEAAIAAGGKCNGTPGVRPEYFATYYGAFVLDPEGRNIEAVCVKPGFWAEPWGVPGWSAVGLGVGTAVGVFGKYIGWF